MTIADLDAEAARRLAAGDHGDVVVGRSPPSATCRKRGDAQRMIADAVAAFGRLDVLVNNAGIQPVDWYFRIEDTPEEVWDRILGVNLKGVFLMSKYAMPEIRAAGRGVVINIASVQGLQSMPGVPSYAASKGGVLSLTRNMALDYAPRGHPGGGHLSGHHRFGDGPGCGSGGGRRRGGQRAPLRRRPPDRSDRATRGHRGRPCCSWPATERASSPAST